MRETRLSARALGRDEEGYQAHYNMSSRVLRKLQSEKGIEDPQFSDQDVDEFLPSKPRRKKKQVVNPFDLVSLL